ncbi:MAG: HRDC domain-containing protein [Spirochaetota bacterium]
MADYTSVGSDAELASFLTRLRDRGVSEVAVDFEGEFNLHVYGERLCLLQIAHPDEEAVVDPFTTSNEALRGFLEDSQIRKITYDSSSDRLLLAKSRGLRLVSIEDLRPAVELLEFPKRDLGSVLETALGHRPAGSKKRFQQYNWTRRPLDPAAVEYALRDVRHLAALRDELFARLDKQGLLDEYRAENERLESIEPNLNRKPGVFRSAAHKRLSPEQKREFQRLYEIRDRHARDLDLPPNTVVANKELFALARGAMDVSSITGNRRVPAERLERIRKEMG